MSHLKSAIIGCGGVARVHAHAINDNTDAHLMATVDIIGERAEKYARKYGKEGCKAYTDYKEMLKDPSIDVVHVCAPHYLHAPMVIDTLKAGKNVITEKPLAISVEQAEAMIAAGKKSDKNFGVILQNRYNLASQEAKKVIDDGKLGKILGARAFVTWYRTKEYYLESNWKGTWEKEGGGVLIDKAIHTIDLMQWLVGEVEWVQGTCHNRFHPYIEVEDVAEAMFQFKNGARGVLFATNYYTYDSNIILEIHGENGKIFIEKDMARIEIGDESYTVKEEQQVKEGKSYWGSSHSTQIAEFYQDVANGKRHWISGEEAKKVLDIVLGIYRSEGKRVELPLKS